MLVSDVVASDTGVPQGTVLSLFLFSLYTTDFQYNTVLCHLQLSDNSAVVGCISEGQEGEYRALVDKFVEWTGQNHLQLNISKTREMVIDFRKMRKTAPQPLCTLGKDVEVVEDYKYLGVTINHRLDWRSNTEAVYKKGMSRLYILRKLKSFSVYSKMLEILYQSVVASVLFFAVVCLGSSIGASDTNRLNKLMKKDGSVIGCKQDTLEAVMERRTLKKLLLIMDNSLHPLQLTLVRQRSTFSSPPRSPLRSATACHFGALSIIPLWCLTQRKVPV